VFSAGFIKEYVNPVSMRNLCWFLVMDFDDKITQGKDFPWDYLFKKPTGRPRPFVKNLHHR